MNKDFEKNKIILAVKNSIANYASVNSDDGTILDISLDSLDVDHIAEAVAEEAFAIFKTRKTKASGRNQKRER